MGHYTCCERWTTTIVVTVGHSGAVAIVIACKWLQQNFGFTYTDVFPSGGRMPTNLSPEV